MKKLPGACLIVLAVVAAYPPAVRNGFVWDDTALILRDPLIRSWRLIPEGFQHFLFTDATPSNFYRPLQRLLYTLEYWPFAVRPAPYHIINVLCHAAAALALFALGRELLRRFGFDERRGGVVALCAAIGWAVHPVHTSAVSYVAGVADPLAATFGFLGLRTALRTDQSDRRGQWLYGASAAALFLFSALSKESGLLFPLLWLVILLADKQWRALARWAAVTLPTLIVYFSLRLAAEHLPTPQIHTPPPPLVRPVIASRAVAEYAALLVWPRNLYMERDLETHPKGANEASFNAAAVKELETLAGLVLIAAFAWWLHRARKRDRAAFVCLLLALASYLPVSGIFALNASMAEHWIYVPSAFFLFALCLTAGRLVSQTSVPRAALVAALGLCVLALAARTFARNFDWLDERTFFERTIRSGGDSPRMLLNLAVVEMNAGQLDAARAHLDRAVAKEPNHPFVLLTFGSLAIRQKDFKAAHEWLDRAAAISFIEAQAQELRVVLANHEQGATDLLRMRLAARTGPPNWQIEKRYVKLLAQSGMQAAAIAELRTVLQREWYRAESWQLLGELLERSGDKAQAGQAMARAHELDVHLDLRPRVL